MIPNSKVSSTIQQPFDQRLSSEMGAVVLCLYLLGFFVLGFFILLFFFTILCTFCCIYFQGSGLSDAIHKRFENSRGFFCITIFLILFFVPINSLANISIFDTRSGKKSLLARKSQYHLKLFFFLSSAFSSSNTTNQQLTDSILQDQNLFPRKLTTLGKKKKKMICQTLL